VSCLSRGRLRVSLPSRRPPDKVFHFPQPHAPRRLPRGSNPLAGLAPRLSSSPIPPLNYGSQISRTLVVTPSRRATYVCVHVVFHKYIRDFRRSVHVRNASKFTRLNQLVDTRDLFPGPSVIPDVFLKSRRKEKRLSGDSASCSNGGNSRRISKRRTNGDAIPQESREISGHHVYPRTCTCTRWNPRTYTDSHTEGILALGRAREAPTIPVQAAATSGRERERERESQVPVGDRDCPAFYHILLYMRERLSLSLSLSLSLFLSLLALAGSFATRRRSLRVFESSSGAIDFSLLVDYRDASRSAIPSTIAPGPTGSLSLSFSLRIAKSQRTCGRSN